MKKLFFLLTILCINAFYCKNTISETEKMAYVVKTWGFLKYYHPNVAQGKFDWDEQLIQTLSKTKTANTKDDFNNLISNWIDSLGDMPKCKLCGRIMNKNYFLKNFDLNWTKNDNIFTKSVIEKLQNIELNRATKQDYFLKSEPTGNVTYKNEKIYKSDFVNNDIAIIELARYWNFVEYFFPYKYLTDQKWDDVLMEMIPKFLNVKNTEDYQILALELVAKIDDSHGFLRLNLNNTIFGKKMLPIAIQVAENKLLVTHVYKVIGEANTLESQIQKNDVIVKINNKTPEEIVTNFSKYIPSSNVRGKWRNAQYNNAFSQTNEDFLDVEVIRDNKTILVHANSFLPSKIEFKSENLNPEQVKWKKLQNNIGYVDIGNLENDDVEKMYKELQNTKTIIFDIRKYPKVSVNLIATLMFPDKYNTVNFARPDLTYPSKFIIDNYITSGKTNNKLSYKGKIIVLVNEVTQSSGEFTAMVFQKFPKSIIIGSQTAGADGNINKFRLLNAETWFTGLGTFYPDGKETQRIGIIPNIIVNPTIKGLQENKDEVLEKAIEEALK